MQAESHTNSYPRLERLRVVRQWTWKQVADALHLSVAMLMSVKSGRARLSKNAEWRLTQAEADAGIIKRPQPADAVPEASPSAGLVVEAHDHEPPEYVASITAEQALDRLRRRNKGLCEVVEKHILAVERWDSQMRKKKKMN